MIPTALLLFACGIKETALTTPPTTAPTGETAEPIDPATVPLDGTCTDATRWGSFFVDANVDYAYVAGSVTNGVVPSSILTNVLTAETCTIWRRENPFCDPSCEPGFTCDFDNSCVPYPEGQDIGTVTVDGLVQDVAMDPIEPGFTYYDTSLPNPPWAPGSLITLTTGGGVYDVVSIYGVAPEALAPTTLDWTLAAGTDFTVRWAPPSEGSRTEVVLSLRIDQHGITPSEIECRFADDGEGTLPAQVLDELMSYGITGFPAGDLFRRTADSAAIDDGCVELVASSSQYADVTIDGYTPCTRDADCPKGQTCNEALERCE